MLPLLINIVFIYFVWFVIFSNWLVILSVVLGLWLILTDIYDIVCYHMLSDIVCKVSLTCDANRYCLKILICYFALSGFV